MPMFAMSLDRFAYGLSDPQEAPVVEYCASCGGEIYGGEVYDFDLNALLAITAIQDGEISPNSDYMHPDCWDECADAHDLNKDERDLIAMLVEL